MTTDPNDSFSSSRSALDSVSLPPIQTIGGWFGPRFRPVDEGMAGSVEGAVETGGDPTSEARGDVPVSL